MNKKFKIDDEVLQLFYDGTLKTKTKLEQDKEGILLTLIKEACLMDCTIAEICLYSGITKPTFYKYMEDERFKNKVEKWRSNPFLKARSNVMSKIEGGDVEVSKWLLERKKKDEFSLRHEVTGADGEGIKVTITDVGGNFAQKTEGTPESAQK